MLTPMLNLAVEPLGSRRTGRATVTAIPAFGASLRRAGAEAAEAWDAARERRAEAQRRRRAVHMVDELLEALEEINLVGRGRVEDPLLALRVRRLERVIGRPAPAKSREARTAVKLHEALLDWQETLLDEALSDRAAYTRLDEESAMIELLGAAVGQR
jgi:hypothetical protein